MKSYFDNLYLRIVNFKNFVGPIQITIFVLFLLGISFLILIANYIPPQKSEIGVTEEQPLEIQETESPKPTASPTPIPILQGKETYSISQSGEVKGPKIHKVEIDPHDPKIGEKQIFKAHIAHNKEVKTATVTVFSDDGKKITYPLSLSSGTALNGIWSGEWETDNTHLFNYAFLVEATDGVNKNKVGIAIR